MNRPEKAFYESIKRAKPHWFFQRIEDSISSGIPDVLCIPDREPTIMIELKAVVYTNVQLRASQIAWLTDYWQKGGKSWVINKCPKTQTIHAWKPPFQLGVGRKGHGKLVSNPDLIVTDLKKLKGSHLSNPTRTLI